MVAQMVKCLPTMRETRVQPLGSGRSPGEGNGNPLQYFCLKHPMGSQRVRHDWTTNTFTIFHIFICSFSICISSFERCLFIFCLLFSGVVFFLIIEFKNFLYILYADILSKLCFAKILLRCEICLFSPLVSYYFGLTSFSKQIYFDTESWCCLCQ